MRELQALVVDDSSLNRRMIAALLSELPGVSHVDLARDGAEALRAVEVHPPDFIALDLEMPRLDGFEFLQLLMDRHPLPVIVISGQSRRDSVFRALELGALDFIAKPEGGQEPLARFRNQLAEKVRVIQQLSPLALRGTSSRSVDREGPKRRSTRSCSEHVARPPSKVIVIGASTGGPRTLVTLLHRLHQPLDAAFVIAQHMPPRFTKTFAQRLDKTGVLRVAEAKSYERLVAGRAYVCPGGRCIEVVPGDRGPAVRLVSPGDGTRYVPSVDQLFQSAARVLGDAAIAVVLTGMGDDGALGAADVARRGGKVLIEEPESAVVSGMPLAVREAGVAHQEHVVWSLGEALMELASLRDGRR